MSEYNLYSAPAAYVLLHMSAYGRAHSKYLEKVQQVRTRLASQKEGLLVFFCDWEQHLSQLRQLITDEEVLQALLLE